MILVILKNTFSYIEVEDLKTKYQTRFEILPHNQDDLRMQVATLKQTIERVIDKHTSLAERICALSHEQRIKIVSILTALSMFISKILPDTAGIFRGGGGPAISELLLPKEKICLNKWLNRQTNAIKRLGEKAVAALLSIVESIVGAT